MSNQSPALACDLSALTDTERERHMQVAQQVFTLKQSVRELPDGYAFQYADEPSTYLLIAEFMSLEHRCCPFFRLALEAEPGEKAINLRISGAEGVKDFIRAELPYWVAE